MPPRNTQEVQVPLLGSFPGITVLGGRALYFPPSPDEDTEVQGSTDT